MTVTIEYFTDVLCIWAYGGRVRIDRLQQDYGEAVRLSYHFIPIFSSANDHIQHLWKHKGGSEGFSQHIQEVAKQWDHVTVSPDVWTKTRPASSTGAHVLLKAIQKLVERGEISNDPVPAYNGRTLFEEAVWRMREAFFSRAENISERAVQEKIVAGLGLPLVAIQEVVDTGEAYAALSLDEQAQQRYRIPGSPTLVFNEGRQLLYGNVGYRIVESNLRELLHNPLHGEASWC